MLHYRRGSNLPGLAGEARVHEDDGGETPTINGDPHGLRDFSVRMHVNFDNEFWTASAPIEDGVASIPRW
jgi:hypothetical protein